MRHFALVVQCRLSNEKKGQIAESKTKYSDENQCRRGITLLSNDHVMTHLCLSVKLFVERVHLEVTVNIIELIVPLVDNFDVKAILVSPPLAGVQQPATVSCLRPCLEQEVQRGAVGLPRILTQFE